MKGIILIVFLFILTVSACFVGVFAVERDSSDKIYLYNYAFAAEKEEDGLHMWLVERTSFSKLETGDGVIYFSSNGYRASRCAVGANGPVFYRADDLKTPVTVTEGENYVGRVIAQW